jgi:hypothetical protein
MNHRIALLAVSCVAWNLACTAAEIQAPILFDFGPDFDISTVVRNDARTRLAGESNMLRIETGHKNAWPGITLKAPAGRWDLSASQWIAFQVRNPEAAPVTVSCRVDNPGADGNKNCVTANIIVPPNATRTLQINLSPTPWRISEPMKLVGMRAAPGSSDQLDTANITQLLVFVANPHQDHVFEINAITAGGRVQTLDSRTFFPFIDEFGQFIHADWPGKTHSEAELKAHAEAEAKDIGAHPAPENLDQYGGWTAGPKLSATGFFRAEKYQGQWWLVDPEGRLFWSHGIDCVAAGDTTPVSDRENYFRALPPSDSPFAKFYARANWAPHGYYQDHSPYRTYDFSQANLLRKYGEDWARASSALAHTRLKSWGMNTIANWSNPQTYRMRRTPYVATISFNSKVLEGSQGYWGKFFDVFDPSFRRAMQGRLNQEKGASVGDPWCLGFFVHNELGWGDDTSLAIAALASPALQPAKKAFLDDLKAKYETIDKLNEAWGSSHASWDALLASTQPPDKVKAGDDLKAFYTRTAETYFEVIREEMKRVAPSQLYLGCRFAWVNERAARAAAKFCDVISYNRYELSVENQRLPEGLDLPIVIGEFHFGALDRGMFHTGLRATASQADRAAAYKNYVQGALRNPLIVGTHWFQYQDQATTGRGDGENYQIGFIDICDTPYPETVAACREVGYSMYPYRLQHKPSAQ